MIVAQLRQQLGRACGGRCSRGRSDRSRGRTTASRRRCDRGPRSRPRGTCSGRGRRGRGARTCAGSSRPRRARPVARRQALERDHRVAAPVGEPVIAGDHGPRLVAGDRARARDPRGGRRAGSRTDRRRARARRPGRCGRGAARRRAGGAGDRARRRAARRASASCRCPTTRSRRPARPWPSGTSIGAEPARAVELAARRVAAALLGRVREIGHRRSARSRTWCGRRTRWNRRFGSGRRRVELDPRAERVQRVGLGDCVETGSSWPRNWSAGRSSSRTGPPSSRR